jgi:hypothetical protein
VTVNYLQGDISVNTKYLLPCSCGRKIQIQLRQAGEIVRCECGTSLEVPKLTGIKLLQRLEVTVEPKITRITWTTGHRLTFFGGLVILAGIVIGGWLIWTRPQDPYANFTPDQMIQAAASRTPLQSLRLWQMLVRGGLERHKRFAEIAYADMQAQYRVYWWILDLFVGIGVGLVAAGVIVLKMKKKKPGTAARA